jgi:hypothetical protein
VVWNSTRLLPVWDRVVAEELYEGVDVYDQGETENLLSTRPDRNLRMIADKLASQLHQELTRWHSSRVKPNVCEGHLRSIAHCEQAKP